ncbi:hypothetical protein GEMRC1_008514 [Eukaryota sp. GEM-RC1]
MLRKNLNINDISWIEGELNDFVSVMDVVSKMSSEFGVFRKFLPFSTNLAVFCYAHCVFFSDHLSLLSSLNSTDFSEFTSKCCRLFPPENLIFLNISVTEQVLDGINHTLFLTLCQHHVTTDLFIVIYHKQSQKVILNQPLTDHYDQLVDFDPQSWEQSIRLPSIDDFSVFDLEFQPLKQQVLITLINTEKELMTRLSLNVSDYYQSLVYQPLNFESMSKDFLSLHLKNKNRKLNPFLFPYCRNVGLTKHHLLFLSSESLVNGDIVNIYLIDENSLLLVIYSLVRENIHFLDLRIDLATSFYSYPFVKLVPVLPIFEIQGDFLIVFHYWFLYFVCLSNLTVFQVVSILANPHIDNPEILETVDYLNISQPSFQPPSTSMPIITISKELLLYIAAHSYNEVVCFKIDVKNKEESKRRDRSRFNFRTKFFNPCHFIHGNRPIPEVPKTNQQLPLPPTDFPLSNTVNRFNAHPLFITSIVREITEQAEALVDKRQTPRNTARSRSELETILCEVNSRLPAIALDILNNV